MSFSLYLDFKQNNPRFDFDTTNNYIIIRINCTIFRAERAHGLFGIIFLNYYTCVEKLCSQLFKLCIGLSERRPEVRFEFAARLFRIPKRRVYVTVRFPFHINLFMRYGLDFDFVKIPRRGIPEVFLQIHTRLASLFRGNLYFRGKSRVSTIWFDKLKYAQTDSHAYFKCNRAKKKK